MKEGANRFAGRAVPRIFLPRAHGSGSDKANRRAQPVRTTRWRTRRSRGSSARVVEELPEPVDAVARDDPRRLTELPGIGEDLAGKIAEIVRTGTLTALRDLEREAPPGAAELMRLPGLGPKRAKALCEVLHV